MTASGADGTPSHWRLYSLIGLMTLLWSINYVIAKLALREMPALLTFGLRTALAGGLIWPIYWWLGRRNSEERWAWADVPKLLYLGLFGVAFNQMLFILGLSRTSVGHASIMIGLTPMIVLLVAWAVGQERIGGAKFAGMGAALGGVAVLQLGEGNERSATFLGDLMVFGASLTFAIFTVSSKAIGGKVNGITLNTFAYVGAGLALLPLTIWSALQFDFTKVTWMAWASIVFMAVFPSITCYLIYSYALQHISASRVSAFSYLQPLVGTLFAIPLLGERPSVSLLAGGALVLSGVFIAERV